VLELLRLKQAFPKNGLQTVSDVQNTILQLSREYIPTDG
jgi:hypothetical protein